MTPAHRLAPALLALLLVATPAAALEPGSIMLAATVTSGTADFAYRDGKYLSADDHGEIGVDLEGWYFLDNPLAFTASGGIGRFRERQELAGSLARIYTQRSWHVRAGFDRVIDFKQDAILYFGPGVEYWKGYTRADNFPGPAASVVTTPDVTRLSVSARFGGIMALTDSFGFTGRIGFRVGYAKSQEGGAKTTWFPNGYEAAAGVIVAIGD